MRACDPFRTSLRERTLDPCERELRAELASPPMREGRPSKALRPPRATRPLWLTDPSREDEAAREVREERMLDLSRSRRFDEEAAPCASRFLAMSTLR